MNDQPHIYKYIVMQRWYVIGLKATQNSWNNARPFGHALTSEGKAGRLDLIAPDPGSDSFLSQVIQAQALADQLLRLEASCPGPSRGEQHESGWSYP